MERPLDQIFLVKSGQKGPDFESGHFTTVKSWKFWKLPKINFFWSEWLENQSKCSSTAKFLDKTLKWAKKFHFCSFSANLVVFDHIWSWLNLPVPAVAKSKFFSRIIKYTSGSPPGTPQFHLKLEKFSSWSHRYFSKFFANKIWSFLYQISAKADCRCLLNHKFTCSR